MYREGDYVCIQCGKPAWISEHLRSIKARAKNGVAVSGAFTAALLRKQDPRLLD